MSRPRRRRPSQIRAARSMGELLNKYAERIVVWSLLAMALATGYILYGIFRGQLTASADPRIVLNLQLMGQVLVVSAALSAICLVVITFEEIAWAVAVGIGGLAYLFGTPFLIANHAQAASRAADAVAIWGTAAGKIIIVVVAVRIVYEIYVQLTTDSLRAKRAKEAEQKVKPVEKAKPKVVGPFTPCWGTPYCHPTIKEICPAFKGRKTCWRFGRGCNCDPGLIESLIRSGGLGASRDSQQRQVQQEYIRSDLQVDRPMQRDRTISCAQCGIYMEHQRAKFRFVNPILVAGTIIAFIVFHPQLMRLYEFTINAMATLASRFTYGSEVDPEAWFTYLNTPTVQVFFLLILGLLVLSWVLRFTEWAILVKKW